MDWFAYLVLALIVFWFAVEFWRRGWRQMLGELAESMLGAILAPIFVIAGLIGIGWFLTTDAGALIGGEDAFPGIVTVIVFAAFLIVVIILALMLWEFAKRIWQSRTGRAESEAGDD